MKHTALTMMAATLLTVLPAYAGQPQPDSHASAHTHWSYEGPAGVPHWAELSAEYKLCSTGKSQSPIDIDTGHVKPGNLKPLEFRYQNSRAEAINNGHTIQLDMAQLDMTNDNAAILNGSEYKLIQFHFHAPSEERINGKPFSMVAHLVHKNAEGNLAVIAVLFNTGEENPGLKRAFSDLPEGEGARKPLSVSAMDLLPSDKSYYTFTGSLTTPPCTEGVAWYVLKNQSTLSQNQLAIFHKLFSGNARPVQPLNGRIIEVSQ